MRPGLSPTLRQLTRVSMDTDKPCSSSASPAASPASAAANTWDSTPPDGSSHSSSPSWGATQPSSPLSSSELLSVSAASRGELTMSKGLPIPDCMLLVALLLLALLLLALKGRGAQRWAAAAARAAAAREREGRAAPCAVLHLP